MTPYWQSLDTPSTDGCVDQIQYNLRNARRTLFTQQLSGLLKDSSEFTLVPTVITNHTHSYSQEDAPKSNLVFSHLFKDTLICELQGPWMKQSITLAAATANLSHICRDNHICSDDSWISPFLNQASRCWIMSISDNIWVLSLKDDLLLRQLRSYIRVLELVHTNNLLLGTSACCSHQICTSQAS